MTDGRPQGRGHRPLLSQAMWRWITVAVFVATIGQLLVGTFATALSQFAGNGFAGRLVAYPLLMLAVPAVWALRRPHRNAESSLPWAGFALLMAPVPHRRHPQHAQLVRHRHLVGRRQPLGELVPTQRGHRTDAPTCSHRATVGSWLTDLRNRRPARGGLRTCRVVHLHSARHRTRHRLSGHPGG